MNKDIDKMLQDSAKEVKVKDFSDRWDNINERISSLQDTELIGESAESVLAASGNINIRQNTTRKTLLCLLSAAFLLIGLCLAIVLPMMLQKDTGPKFFSSTELSNIEVSENEFYDEIENSGLEIADFSSMEFDLYILSYSPDKNLVGGTLEVVNEEEYLFLTINIYKENVKHDYDTGINYKQLEINNYSIKYKTEDVDGLYVTKAKATGRQFNYYIDYVGLDENIEGFFERVFG